MAAGLAKEEEEKGDNTNEETSHSYLPWWPFIQFSSSVLLDPSHGPTCNMLVQAENREFSHFGPG